MTAPALPSLNTRPPLAEPPRLSLEAVYAEHFRFVWRSLRRLGVPEADARDATQEVFLVVHARLATFEGRSKLTTWLFAICMNVARDRRKKAHMRYEVSDDEAVQAREDSSPDAIAQAERRQRLALVEAVLDAMDLPQRTVFALFELEGIACEEIASLLEIPLGTVYSRLRLGREAFRQILGRLQARERFQPLSTAGRPA